MSGGLMALWDDIASLAKMAAASVDDVGAAAAKASAKAAGVVVDDTAVTPNYVRGVAAARELPIIKKIAIGSLRNKLLLILPVAMLLSEFLPDAMPYLLILGGLFLCFEGAEKVYELLTGTHEEELPSPEELASPEHESRVVRGAVRTDLILSAEIMAISLASVEDEPFVTRLLILIVVAVVITIIVYGVVALIVKMDDIGLKLAQRPSESSQRMGKRLVEAMPKVMNVLGLVGTAAMLWVGGHILLVNMAEAGFHGPEDVAHDVSHWFRDLFPSALQGVAGWLGDTVTSAIVGLVAGAIVVTVLHQLPRSTKRH